MHDRSQACITCKSLTRKPYRVLSPCDLYSSVVGGSVRRIKKTDVEYVSNARRMVVPVVPSVLNFHAQSKGS